MNGRGPSEVEALIAEEKRLVALECHTEAWADAVSEGVEAEIVADAAISTALIELIRAEGEVRALEMIDDMRKRINAGDFTCDRMLH